jgi:hypothetical protein
MREAPGMIEIPAQAAMGWGSTQSAAEAAARTRLRDMVPAIAAVVALTLAHFAFGAVQPIAALAMSALLTAIAVVMLLAAGPKHVTLGMLIGGALIVLVGITGVLGPMDRAGSSLAVLFAAGAVWSMGYIAARHRSALDAIWTVLIWGSIAYCVWMFIGDVATSSTDQGLAIGDAFETPANAAILFGLMALVGMARVLHIVKQMYAEGLPGSHMIDRVLRGGLGGLLLLTLSLTCLAIAGSRPGMLMVAGVLIGHAWWDLLPILTRNGSGLLARLAAFVLPFAAIGFAAWGVSSSAGSRTKPSRPVSARANCCPTCSASKPIWRHGLRAPRLATALAPSTRSARSSKPWQRQGDAGARTSAQRLHHVAGRDRHWSGLAFSCSPSARCTHAFSGRSAHAAFRGHSCASPSPQAFSFCSTP